MRPVESPYSNGKFVLHGGTCENDLPVEMTTDTNGNPAIRSIWRPTSEERSRIADGEDVYLVVWGTGTPPVAMGVTTEAVGQGRVDGDPATL